LRVTGDVFSTFPSFPAAQQTRASTSEYYSRVTAHQVAFEGFLDQTLGVAFTRKRTATLEPDSPQPSLATGERIKIDWQGALKFTPAHTLVLGAEHARDSISEPISAGNRIESGYAELQSRLLDGLYSAINVRYDQNDRFGGKVTYRVAPAYVIAATGTKLKASVARGSRRPR